MSERNDILEAYKTLLGGIVVGLGYNYTMRRSERKRLNWDSSQPVPAVMVLGGSETFEEDLGGGILSEMSITIRAMHNDPVDPEETASKLLADVLKRLESSSNTYHGGMRIDGVNIDDEWFTEGGDGMVMFDVLVRQVYSFTRGTP